MRFFRLAVLLVPLSLAACSLSPQEQADLAVVHNSGVNPAVYDMMERGIDLDVADVTDLHLAGVPDDVILRYLREKRTVFYLTKINVGVLKTAGVSDQVIDYMGQTPRMYTSYNGAIGNGLGYFPYYDPFWGPPYPNYPNPPHYAH
jgi:hypothetical protein